MKEHFWKFIYELKYAGVGLKRHFWLSFSALAATVVTLFLIGILTISGLHIDLFSNQVEDNLGIHVVLDAQVESQEEIERIEERLKALPGVDFVEFSSKEEELEKMIQEKGEAFSMYRGKDNPLSHAFLVYVKDSKDIQKIAKEIQKVQGVEDIAYGGNSTISFVDMLYKLRKIGYIAMALLVILSLYLIYNTIRTMIASRADEIIIMRQVGATNSFIKRPFEWEGIILGLIGALIPFGFLWAGYRQLYEMLQGKLFALTLKLMPVQSMTMYLGIVLIVCGIGIGWFASFIATSKFIKEKR